MEHISIMHQSSKDLSLRDKKFNGARTGIKTTDSAMQSSYKRNDEMILHDYKYTVVFSVS